MIVINGWKYLTKAEVKEKYEVTTEELEWFVKHEGLKKKIVRYQTYYEMGGIIYYCAHRKRSLDRRCNI